MRTPTMKVSSPNWQFVNHPRLLPKPLLLPLTCLRSRQHVYLLPAPAAPVRSLGHVDCAYCLFSAWISQGSLGFAVGTTVTLKYPRPNLSDVYFSITHVHFGVGGMSSAPQTARGPRMVERGCVGPRRCSGDRQRDPCATQMSPCLSREWHGSLCHISLARTSSGGPPSYEVLGSPGFSCVGVGGPLGKESSLLWTLIRPALASCCPLIH